MVIFLATCCHLSNVNITNYYEKWRIHDETHWFVDFHFEASSLDFGRRHLVFLEPEVMIFLKDGDTELVVSQHQTSLSEAKLAAHPSLVSKLHP